MPRKLSDSNVCDKDEGVRTEVITNDPSTLVLTKWVVSVMYVYVSHYFSSFGRREVRVVQCPPGVRCTSHNLLTLGFSV